MELQVVAGAGGGAWDGEAWGGRGDPVARGAGGLVTAFWGESWGFEDLAQGGTTV